MNQKDVISILGKPDRKYLEEDTDDNELVLEWKSLMLRLTFYRDENNRFGYLRTRNKNFSFESKAIINQPIEIVKKEVFKNAEYWEIDEYNFMRVYFNEENWIALNCEYDLVLEIEMGVPFRNDSDYNWPK
ncbi:hypothetical protein C7S20_12555 [Christiangramia fulva]|uniref:Uncharacterized protein n=2 Tax=Christiangramia fulva TaxID=2126553 RepID=A0A2R3Z6V9_9FLAO|nr:hypothetical protein C7S20_12555 [Christiangramia fulva]